jgi:hypothetical protein
VFDVSPLVLLSQLRDGSPPPLKGWSVRRYYHVEEKRGGDGLGGWWWWGGWSNDAGQETDASKIYPHARV